MKSKLLRRVRLALRRSVQAHQVALDIVRVRDHMTELETEAAPLWERAARLQDLHYLRRLHGHFIGVGNGFNPFTS